MPMAKNKLVRDYFGCQLFITTSGHFSTPALTCAIQEIGARSCMFAIDYPFESIPNGCTWLDEHVPLNGHDLVDIGRNNALNVFPRLKDAIHGVQPRTPAECRVGGLGLRSDNEAEPEYGLYNKDWSKRLIRR
jgi:2,3-dihydroxybenzoate decarboxylase